MSPNHSGIITIIPRATVDYSSWEPGTEALYLDDNRTPRENHYFKWVIVRDYRAFCNYIMQQGMPKFISFDHDLADEHVQLGAMANWKDFDYTLCTEMTGYDAAKWLVEYCLDNDVQMPHFTVHSANPAGAENILGLLNNLQKEQGQIPNGYRTHW
jgi:hypothetical protein